MAAEDPELERLRAIRRKQLLAKGQKPDPSVDKPTPTRNSAFVIPTSVVKVSTNDFDRLIEESPLPVLIEFWAEWYQPCSLVAPIIEALERRYRGRMIFGKVNVDQEHAITSRFSINSIPAFYVFHQKNIIDQFVGALAGQKFDEKVRGILDLLATSAKGSP